MKWTVVTFILSLSLLLQSCSKNDYVNVVPKSCTAVMSIDARQLAAGDSDAGKIAGLLKLLVQIDNLDECGIDFSEKVYLFETVEGNLGMVMRVADHTKLENVLTNTAKYGLCTELSERKDYKFTLINNSWQAGLSSDAFVVIGPIVASQQSDMQLQIARYLGQDDEHSIKSSPLFAKLDSLSGAKIALVARLSALPEMLAAPFMLGAPKGTDASQIVLAASFDVEDKIFEMRGHTFSFNKQIDEVLHKSLSAFRPIEGLYSACIPRDASAAMFVNVDGAEFVDILHANKDFTALLTGVNTIIDMDNIIRCVDGDMAITLMSMNNEYPDMRIAAKLAKSDFLDDVDYWKESCPKGGRIYNIGKDAYCYSSGSYTFCFGVSPDNQFYSGPDRENADVAIKASSAPVSMDIQESIKGNRLCMVISLASILGNDGIQGLVKPFISDIETLIIKL